MDKIAYTNHFLTLLQQLLPEHPELRDKAKQGQSIMGDLRVLSLDSQVAIRPENLVKYQTHGAIINAAQKVINLDRLTGEYWRQTTQTA